MNTLTDQKMYGRRDFLALSAAAVVAGTAGFAVAGGDPAQQMMPGMPMPLPPGPRPKVAMLVYPKMVMLDLVGPLTVLNILRADIDLYWKDKTPCMTDTGIPISATKTLDECPTDVDVLFVPGGLMGTIDLMTDEETLDFLADRGGRAKWVTSVCTGSLVLGAAGLLVGKKATSHWGVVDLLPLLGAKPTEGRVIEDGNRITAGGLTAGIDFGLKLAAILKGEEEARRIQLTMEYSPEPPFKNGTPAEAGPQRMVEARIRRRWMDAQAKKATEKAHERLKLHT